MASPDIDEMTSRLSGLGRGASNLDDNSEFDRIRRDYEHLQDKDRRAPLDENDPKVIMREALDQFKTLTTAVSVPLFQVVKTYNGDPNKFKIWEREVERYAQMAKLGDEDVPRIAYVTCSGSIELFIKRYLEQKENDFESPKWSELKHLLQKRFSYVQDPQQAMAILRKIRQRPEESVQIFSERFLRVAEDAFPENPCNETAKNILEKQLVDIFCDSLYHDYLRLKLMREDPQDYESAVSIAMNEQNLRKRFALRSGSEETNYDLQTNTPYPHQSYVDEARNTHQNITHFSQMTDSRNIEPMDVDHLRRNLCYKCKRTGHKPQDCPQNRGRNDRQTTPRLGNRNYRVAAANVGQINVDRNTSQQGVGKFNVPEWVKKAECWSCNEIGHLQRNCPNRRQQHRNGPFRPQHRNGFRGRQEN